LRARSIEVAGDLALPGVDAEGAHVFALGITDGLKEGLAEIGDAGGGARGHGALGDGGDAASQGGAEIARGDVAAGEIESDIIADLFDGTGLSVFAGMEGAEERMTSG